MTGNRVTEEKIIVVAYSGYRGEETPREFIFRGKKVEVLGIVSAWIEQRTDYKAIRRFFEVKGSDGSIHKSIMTRKKGNGSTKWNQEDNHFPMKEPML